MKHESHSRQQWRRKKAEEGARRASWRLNDEGVDLTYRGERADRIGWVGERDSLFRRAIRKLTGAGQARACAENLEKKHFSRN